ncbi:MAG: GNAT family N-acetyltransferase, partial [bacterium]|nr:GNAT family N-acetyltransferase [bacterium]
LIEIKKEIPLWVRIERVIRDIPKKYIVEGGAQISNLRELVQEGLKKGGAKCKCIRCREVGTNYNPKDKLYLFKEEYLASEGKEFFLSFETKNREKLYALLRLRLPLKNEVAMIREIHTYGQMAEIVRGLPSYNYAQHKGLGRKLMEEAETIAKKAGFKSIAVIAGVGVRGYYRKLGYHLKDTYMFKCLNDLK